MNSWPFWMFEENVKLVNEIIEEEETNRKKGEEEQSQGIPDTNSMMKSASNMTNGIGNFTMPKF